MAGLSPDELPQNNEAPPATSLSVRRSRRFVGIGAAVLPLILAPGVASAADTSAATTAAASSSAVPLFTEVNLVSDLPGRAQLLDPALVNPWGLALGPTSPLWVADNGTDRATVYAKGPSGPITKVGLEVPIPSGAPTGQ